MGLKDLCQQIHQVYRTDNLPNAQKEMYTTLPEMLCRLLRPMNGLCADASRASKSIT